MVAASGHAQNLLKGGKGKFNLDAYLKRVSDRGKQARQQLDNVGKTIAKIQGPRKAIVTTQKLTSAGDKLDKMMRRFSRNASKGQERVARAVEGTRKAVARTDEQLKKADKSGRRAAKSMRLFGSSSGIASQSLTRLIAKTSAFIGVVAGLRDVTREYGEFDQAATAAVAKFSKFDKDLKPGTDAFSKFKEEMRAAAQGTEHSAAGVARAVDFWAKAGKSPEQAKAVLKATLDFASANQDAEGSMLDVARAGDILSDALGQFKLNSSDAATMMQNTARVSDVMSAAANSANMSAEELFDAFKTAGPTLKAVGSDIEETSALLAAMANAGIKGDKAGTQLKMSIANLSAMTGPQEASMRKLGVSVKDADGNFRGLTTIIRDLNDATKDMGTGDRFQVFAKAVGRRAIPSFINLLAEGKVNLDRMSDSLRGATGETQRIADMMRQSATAQMAQFKNKLRDVGFEIIEKTGVVGKLTKAINDIDWKSVYETIRKDVIPAFKTVGKIISGTVIPAFRTAWDTISNVLSPAVKLLSKLFGTLSGESKVAANVLGGLISLWVTYRGYLLATKAVGIISWFRQLITSIGATTVAQGALNTEVAATNKTWWAQVKAVGKLQSALGALTAFVVGWEIGTILHDKLVEPFMAARHEQRLLFEEYNKNKKDKESPNKQSFGVVTDDLKTAQAVLAKRKKSLAAAKSEGGGAFLPSLTADVTDAENEVKRLTNKLSLLRTQANIKKYDVSASEEAYSSVSQSGLVTDYEEDFSPGTYQGGGSTSGGKPSRKQSPRIPGEDYGQSFEMTPLLEEIGQSTEYQRQSLEIMKKSEPKSVTQNITTGPTTINVHTQSTDPKAIVTEVRRQQEKMSRQQRNDIALGVRNIAPAEI